MFEQELLRADVEHILQTQRDSAQRLRRLLEMTDDPGRRDWLSQLQAHAARDLRLTERLAELAR